MFNLRQAKELLYSANIFFENKIPHEINLNDVFGWAMADGEEVSDEELPEVAELFFYYGWCGILYWVHKKRNNMKSEFQDVNRFISFVKIEEQIKKDYPRHSERAYKKEQYIIGPNNLK